MTSRGAAGCAGSLIQEEYRSAAPTAPCRPLLTASVRPTPGRISRHPGASRDRCPRLSHVRAPAAFAADLLRDAAVFLHMDATVDISKFKIVKATFPQSAGVYAGPEK